MYGVLSNVNVNVKTAETVLTKIKLKYNNHLIRCTQVRLYEIKFSSRGMWRTKFIANHRLRLI